MTAELDRAASILKDANKVVVSTGAGMSRDSGVPTFRDAMTGLWARFDPHELANAQAFTARPARVFGWYVWRWNLVRKADPHAGYRALVRLEKAFDELLVVTQNVDGLHRKAGSSRIVELHGNIWRTRCIGVCPISENHEVPMPEIPPRCGRCGELIRPDVVWFGEGLNHGDLEKAFGAAETCDAMIVVGTSAVVQPAASLPVAAKQGGADAISAINTLRAITEVDLDSFSPKPAIQGRGSISGYSGPAVKPIALRFVAELAQSRELQAYNAIADHYSVINRLTVTVDYFRLIGGSALTDKSIALPEGDPGRREILIE